MGHRNSTPKEEQRLCGRCGEVANPTDGWEHRWPLRGNIEIGFPAQAFGALCGMKHIADHHHFKWWQEGHPAMLDKEHDNGAQFVRFQWNCDAHWRLCYDCQKELLRVIGAFFKIPDRAEELKKET